MPVIFSGLPGTTVLIVNNHDTLRPILDAKGNYGPLGDAPERDNGTQLLHLADRSFEEIAAGRYLFRRRLILRRHTAHRIGDSAVDQFESVIGAGSVVAAREAEFSQRRVKEIAGIIAGERPPGAVRALEAWREADDQEARAARTERGDRRIEPCGLGRD